MWQFNSPEIIFGEDALSRLAEKRPRCPVLITDVTMVELGYSQMIIDHLGSDIQPRVFAEVDPEPSIQTTERACEFMNEATPDTIIALGGGSVLDVAKVAWFLYEHPSVKLDEISIFDTYSPPKSQLIAVPTTSGSGAEVTVGAVLTDRNSRRKVTVYAYELQATMVIVDPSLTGEMPRQLIADTGVDVISHAIESYTGAWHNDFSDGLSVQALRLALRFLTRSWADENDQGAREHMHNAATIAGLAITNSSIALGHALAHSLGAILSIPHGRAIGIMLPYSMTYTVNGGGTRYAELARQLGHSAGSEAEGLAELLNVLQTLFNTISQPSTIRELGVSSTEFEQALPQLVAGAAEDHQLLTTVRVPNEDELGRLYRCAYDGLEVDF